MSSSNGTNGKESGLFVRQATGLVRSWSVFDAFIYAFFSVNLITLGLYIFAFAPYIPEGNLVTAVVISTILIIFLVIVYAMLVSILPRAGGDYVIQTRILGGPLSYVLPFTGWVFILWLWVTLYGNMLSWNVFTPLFTLLGTMTGSEALLNTAFWFNDVHGLFFSSIMVCILASVVISLGMKGYARVQKFCFYLGMLGLLTVFIMLLVNDKSVFIERFNAFSAELGANENVYGQIIDRSAEAGYDPIAWNNLAIVGSLPLIPMIVFWNLWPNWGATLYGEVRGASEFKRNFLGMFLGLMATGILAVILLALFNRTFGWDFYLTSNFAFFEGLSPFPVFPFPGLLAAILTENPVLQLWVIISLSAWFFGWMGTVFLSSTRVLFAASFDRMLPEWVSRLNPKTRSPYNALFLMTIPGIAVSFLYYYVPGFDVLTLNTTVVITVCFLGTAIAAIVLPYRKPELYNTSPVARYKVLGIPAITVCGVILAAFLLFNIILWIIDPVYGVNDPYSAVFMLVLYGIAFIIYYYYKYRNKKHGIEVEKTYEEIPME